MPGTAVGPGEIEALGERGFFIREGFLGRNLALAAGREVDRLWQGGHLRPGRIRRGPERRVDFSVRRDLIAWLEELGEGEVWRKVSQRFEQLRVGLNQAAFLGLQETELQVSCYPGEGAHYVRHLDVFTGGPPRKITAICYLNPDWKPSHGGQLRLFLPEGEVVVEPLLDRLVVFLSDQVEHEVLPAFAARRAVTAWFRRRASGSLTA